MFTFYLLRIRIYKRVFESPGVASDPQWQSPSLARTHPHLSRAALQCACLFAAIPRPRRRLLAKVPSDFYHCENSLLPISGLSGAYEYTLQSREGKQVTRELAWGQKPSPQVQKKEKKEEKKRCCSVSSRASAHPHIGTSVNVQCICTACSVSQTAPIVSMSSPMSSGTLAGCDLFFP